MKDIKTNLVDLKLVRPDPDRDAPYAVAWFESPDGKETLLLMGNMEKDIDTPSLQKEADRIREFIKLEQEDKQLTWMIRYDNKTIGAVWLDLHDTEYVKSPAIHIMIGDKSYRGKGIGRIAMQAMIDYVKSVLKAKTIYSRHLTSNHAIAHVSVSLGFVNDGAPYKDSDGLEFQNIKLSL